MTSRAEVRVGDDPAEFAPADAYIPLCIRKRRTVRGEAQVEELHTPLYPFSTHIHVHRHTCTHTYINIH